ncbi:glycosyltransferase family 61 protein [Reyranella sp.]|uniref:glycosyltransferase family 61 protein n=1 Tax=Reyranella sp. TaxID=1929291 RepID=UPI003BADA146
MEWLQLNSEMTPRPAPGGERVQRGAKICHFSYDDAVLDSASGGVICENRYMPPSRGARYNLSSQEIQSIVADATHSESAELSVAVGYRAGWRNYYHWTTQCLLNTYSLLQGGALNDSVLAVPSLRGVHARSLELLGIGREKLFQVGSTRAIRAKRFIVTNVMFASTPRRFPHELKSMARALKSAAAIKTTDARPAIYISRLDSLRRKMSNEEDLIKALEKLGVQHVSMTGQTLEQQMGLISNARLIVAPHGAGLTNILYATPGTHLYELFPASYTPNCFQRLAQATGITYTSSVFQPTSGGRHDSVWSADVYEICRNADAQLQHTARSKEA